MKLSATLKTARAMRDFVLGATAAALAKRADGAFGERRRKGAHGSWDSEH